MLLTNLADTRTQVSLKLAQASASAIALSPTELDDAISEALDYFNVLAPKEGVHEQAGTGLIKRVVLSDDVTDWKDETSSVSEVQEVIDPNTDEETIAVLIRGGWRTARSADGKDILYVEEATPADRTLRINWTTPHTLTDLEGATVTTIPERHSQTLLLLATSTGAALIAAKATDLANANLGANVVDLSEFTGKWLAISRDRRRMAEKRLGGNPGQSVGVSVNWRTGRRLNTEDRVGHP